MQFLRLFEFYLRGVSAISGIVWRPFQGIEFSDCLTTILRVVRELMLEELLDACLSVI